MNYQYEDELFEEACLEAIEELIFELGRDPTEKEIEERAHYLIENNQPDWDSMIKDKEFDCE